MFSSVFKIDFEESRKKIVRMFHEGMLLGCPMKDKSYRRNKDGSRYDEAFHAVYWAHTGGSYVLHAYYCAGPNIDEDLKSECLKKARHANPKQSVAEHFSAMAVTSMRFTPNMVKDDVPTARLLEMLAYQRRLSGLEAMSSQQLDRMVRDCYRVSDLLQRHRGGSLICDAEKKKVEFRRLSC